MSGQKEAVYDPLLNPGPSAGGAEEGTKPKPKPTVSSTASKPKPKSTTASKTTTTAKPQVLTAASKEKKKEEIKIEKQPQSKTQSQEKETPTSSASLKVDPFQYEFSISDSDRPSNRATSTTDKVKTHIEENEEDIFAAAPESKSESEIFGDPNDDLDLGLTPSSSSKPQRNTLFREDEDDEENSVDHLLKNTSSSKARGGDLFTKQSNVTLNEGLSKEEVSRFKDADVDFGKMERKKKEEVKVGVKGGVKIGGGEIKSNEVKAAVQQVELDDDLFSILDSKSGGGSGGGLNDLSSISAYIAQQSQQGSSKLFDD